MTTAAQSTHDKENSGRQGRHRWVGIACAVIAVGMLGMAYAAVPLYRMFCQVTGFAGTPQVAIAPSSSVIDKVITMRFDSNVSPELNWTFKPKDLSVDLKIGENGLATYVATNNSSETVTGTATYNVTPEVAGAYFNKIECFCFTEQTLKPGQSVEMPVSYFIDPAIVKDRDARHLTQITLSYTFFAVKEKDAAQATEKKLRTSREKSG